MKYFSNISYLFLSFTPVYVCVLIFASFAGISSSSIPPLNVSGIEWIEEASNWAMTKTTFGQVTFAVERRVTAARSAHEVLSLDPESRGIQDFARCLGAGCLQL